MAHCTLNFAILQCNTSVSDETSEGDHSFVMYSISEVTGDVKSENEIEDFKSKTELALSYLAFPCPANKSAHLFKSRITFGMWMRENIVQTSRYYYKI